jgi:hypothetical protein
MPPQDDGLPSVQFCPAPGSPMAETKGSAPAQTYRLSAAATATSLNANADTQLQRLQGRESPR